MSCPPAWTLDRPKSHSQTQKRPPPRPYISAVPCPEDMRTSSLIPMTQALGLRLPAQAGVVLSPSSSSTSSGR